MQLKSGSTVGGNPILTKAGTNNYVAKFGNDNNLINSLISDDGVDVKINGYKVLHDSNISTLIGNASSTSAGLMSSADKVKLDSVAPGAGTGGTGTYVHPTGDGWNHVLATGTISDKKVLKAGPNAGDNLWGFVDWAELTSKPTTFTPPIASSTVLGGVKIGSGITLDATTGTISVVSGGGAAPVLLGSRAVSTDASGNLAASTTTAAELSYLNGVTSAVQTQINNKQDYISGAASTITSSNVSANKTLISDINGKVTAGNTTAAELGYLSGVTSAVQTQLNGKQATITGGASSITSSNLGINLALISDANGKVITSNATAAELGYLSGVTSAIQTQLNGKQATIIGGASSIAISNLAINLALISDANGKVTSSSATATELSYLSGVTSAIQTQLNGKQATITGATSNITSTNLTSNKAVLTDNSGKITTGAVSTTELGYLSGVKSSIQNQLNQTGDLSTLQTNTKTDLTSALNEVIGYRTNTSKAFTVEVRTTDPTSPAVGQMWLRSDL